MARVFWKSELGGWSARPEVVEAVNDVGTRYFLLLAAMAEGWRENRAMSKRSVRVPPRHRLVAPSYQIPGGYLKCQSAGIAAGPTPDFYPADAVARCQEVLRSHRE